MPRHHMATYTELTLDNLDTLTPQERDYRVTVDSVSIGGRRRALVALDARGRQSTEWALLKERIRRQLRLIKRFNLPVRMDFQPYPTRSTIISNNMLWLRPNGIVANAEAKNTLRAFLRDIRDRERVIEEYHTANANARAQVATLATERRSIIGYEAMEHIMRDTLTWPHVLEASFGGVLDKAAPRIELGRAEAAMRFVPVLFKNPLNMNQWAFTTPMVFRMPQEQEFVPKSIDGMGHPHTYQGSGDLCWGQGDFNTNLHHNVVRLAQWVIGLNENSIAQGNWYTLSHNWWRANADRYFEVNENPVYVEGNPGVRGNGVAQTHPLTRDLINDFLAANGQWARGVTNRALIAALRANNFRIVDRPSLGQCSQCQRMTRHVIRYGRENALLCEHCISAHTERWSIVHTAALPGGTTLHAHPLLPGYHCTFDSRHQQIGDIAQGQRYNPGTQVGPEAVVQLTIKRTPTDYGVHIMVCRAHWHRIRMLYNDRIETWPAAGIRERDAHAFNANREPVAWDAPTAEEVRLWNEGQVLIDAVTGEPPATEPAAPATPTAATPFTEDDAAHPRIARRIRAIRMNPAVIVLRDDAGRFLQEEDIAYIAALRTHLRGQRAGEDTNAPANTAVLEIPVFNVERDAEGNLIMRAEGADNTTAITIAEGTPLATAAEEVVTITLNGDTLRTGAPPDDIDAPYDGHARYRLDRNIPHLTHDYYGVPVARGATYFRINSWWVIWRGMTVYAPIIPDTVDRYATHEAVQPPAMWPQIPPERSNSRPRITWGI